MSMAVCKHSTGHCLILLEDTVRKVLCIFRSKDVKIREPAIFSLVSGRAALALSIVHHQEAAVFPCQELPTIYRLERLMDPKPNDPKGCAWRHSFPLKWDFFFIHLR